MERGVESIKEQWKGLQIDEATWVSTALSHLTEVVEMLLKSDPNHSKALSFLKNILYLPKLSSYSYRQATEVLEMVAQKNQTIIKDLESILRTLNESHQTENARLEMAKCFRV